MSSTVEAYRRALDKLEVAIKGEMGERAITQVMREVEHYEQIVLRQMAAFDQMMPNVMAHVYASRLAKEGDPLAFAHWDEVDRLRAESTKQPPLAGLDRKA